MSEMCRQREPRNFAAIKCSVPHLQKHSVLQIRTFWSSFSIQKAYPNLGLPFPIYPAAAALLLRVSRSPVRDDCGEHLFERERRWEMEFDPGGQLPDPGANFQDAFLDRVELRLGPLSALQPLFTKGVHKDVGRTVKK